MPSAIRYYRLYTAFFLCCLPLYSAQATTLADQLQINLSNEVQIAVNNGVKLVFDCNYSEHQSLWLTSRHEKRHHHQFELQRHSLSNRYVVRRDDLETQRIFRSMSEASAYISTQAILLYEFYHKQGDTDSVRITLNKYDLPGPMRLGAFLTGSWSVDSGWAPK